MKLAVRNTTTAIAALATVGVSSLFLGSAPASAAMSPCGADGTLISPGVCEQSYTSGSATFIPHAGMSTLEVLLVGAGGSGADQPETNANGYAAAGGGGEVKIVDFSGATSPINLVVASPGVAGTASDGSTSATVANGEDGFGGDNQTNTFALGGTSGSGMLGASSTYGGGGGAGASPVAHSYGGAGVMVSTLAATGSLFSDNDDCYGGGGAIGSSSTQGIPGCGGGGPADATGTALALPVANSGGGGGGLTVPQTTEARAGADGIIVIRWSVTEVTLAFEMNGHGTAPDPQTIFAGNPGVQPVDPTAEGFSFEGWYTDPQLTIPADFSAALMGSTTFYASWAEVLAVTGGVPAAGALPLGIAGLLAGAGLFIAARQRRSAS